jgi:hypothetical protein
MRQFPLALDLRVRYVCGVKVLKAHFDGKVLVPDEPVDLPTDCVLEVRIERLMQKSAQGNSLQRLLDVARRFAVSDGPRDGAEQHDRYLYGLPKRP